MISSSVVESGELAVLRFGLWVMGYGLNSLKQIQGDAQTKY